MFGFGVLSSIVARLDGDRLPPPRLCSGCTHPDWQHDEDGCRGFDGVCDCIMPRRFYGIA